nr:MAG TPA: hypothetical protein [Caudoviricetes sp.]
MGQQDGSDLAGRTFGQHLVVYAVCLNVSRRVRAD